MLRLGVIAQRPWISCPIHIHLVHDSHSTPAHHQYTIDTTFSSVLRQLYIILNEPSPNQNFISAGCFLPSLPYLFFLTFFSLPSFFPLSLSPRIGAPRGILGSFVSFLSEGERHLQPLNMFKLLICLTMTISFEYPTNTATDTTLNQTILPFLFLLV